jgi:hypothetical protein
VAGRRKTIVTVKLVDWRYSVKFPYNPAHVELIKNTVYWRGREWDAKGRQWLVDPMYMDVLEQAFINAGCEFRGETTERPPADPAHVLTNDLKAPTWSMILFNRIHNVDPEAVSLFYRMVRRAVRKQPTLAVILPELRAGYDVITGLKHPEYVMGMHEAYLK